MPPHSSPVRAKYGVFCELIVWTKFFFLSYCIQYRVIFDRVISIFYSTAWKTLWITLGTNGVCCLAAITGTTIVVLCHVVSATHLKIAEHLRMLHDLQMICRDYMTRYPIFKQVAKIWLHDRVPGQYLQKWPPGWHTLSCLNQTVLPVPFRLAS